jgi:hypothetical protein
MAAQRFQITLPPDFPTQCQQLLAFQQLQVFSQRCVHSGFLSGKAAQPADLLKQAVVNLEVSFHGPILIEFMYTNITDFCT